MKPRVTIIIPVYNVEKYLARCLDSVLGQRVSCWDAVLVDDGSCDGSGAIADAYAARDGRFHVIHRQNGGLSAARNTGIEWALQNCMGEYLSFLDSDDWLHPQFLELMLDAMESTGAGVAMAGRNYTKSDSVLFPEIYAKPECMTAEELFLRREWDFNFAWGKLYRREDFRTLRFPEGKVFEDVFTTYRVLFGAESVALVDAPLYCYFYNREGISHSPWTEQELVIFEGMEEQLAFYQARGFTRAYEKEHRLYLNHFAYQIARIRENRAEFEKNKHHIPVLRRRMLAIIRESRGRYTLANMPQCFAEAYPAAWKCRNLAYTAVRIRKDEGFRGVLRRIRERLTER